MRFVRIMLVIVAVACFGVALSYPIRYYLAQKSNDSNMEQLAEMRAKVREDSAEPMDIAKAPANGDESDSGTTEGPSAVESSAEASAPADAFADSAPLMETDEGSTDVAIDAAPPTEADEGSTDDAIDAMPPTETDEGSTDVAIDAAPPTETDEGSTGITSDAAPSTEAGAETRAQSDASAVGNEPADAGPSDDSVGASEADPEEQLPRFPSKPTLQPDGDGASDAAPESEGDSTPAPALDGGIALTPEPEEAHKAAEDSAEAVDTRAASEMTAAPAATPTPEPTPTPDPYYWDLGRFLDPTPTPTPKPTEGPTATPTPVPTPTPDRSIRTGPLPYSMKDKVTLDEAAILPELKDIYALNHDLVGWVTIPGTVIDYPVVQCDDPDFYLSHDFYGEENNNGQIILDPLCDPYTPSYNLILSGHHMKSGSMFGNLPEYRTKGYWEKHRFLEFDSLMERKQYVIFAAFYSADYDENEEGFRYNANLVYKIDVKQWLAEIAENQLYETGVEAEFGDEFITLTTCNRARHRNGRFVVVCRRIREGETFE